MCLLSCPKRCGEQANRLLASRGKTMKAHAQASQEPLRLQRQADLCQARHNFPQACV